ncbi:dimethyl sulfoxide reductase anchor subunit, partial [Adlercreutzia equolifaciens]|uniref:DmsC/YnfH family molybdoenzyme membrane anchor subunit n=1 Tax=Adlercreutzia equolifaciens TaxID=446660 RepID=UPI0023B13AB5
NALSHPTSGIFVEAVHIGLLAVAVIVYLVCVKREIAGGIKASAVCGMIFGVALSYMAGHSYIMAAIETWNTMLLPSGYLLTALPMGSSLYWALAGREEAASKFMGVCTLVCG